MALWQMCRGNKKQSWLSRNSRGIRTLYDLVKKEDPDFAFLQEIKVNAYFISFKKFIFYFQNVLFVDYDARSSGLVLLWKNFEVIQYCTSHIHGVIDLGSEGQGWWWLIGVYGNLEAYQRPETWGILIN